MGVNLYWRPINKGKVLPSRLKMILQNTENRFPLRVDGQSYDYFLGLKDAGIDGAEEVLDLIDKYGEIMLELE